MNDPITTAIKQVLDTWKHTQLNIASDSARDMLTQELTSALQPVIVDYIESIVAPDDNSTETY